METDALHRRLAKLGHVLEVARTLANERDLDTILASVLRAAALVAEADRSSIFLLDRERGELWTRLAQGVSSTTEIRTPIGVGLAGHVAATGEAINIPRAYDDPRFNRSVDQATGYHTESLMTVPMRLASGKETGQVVGVLQVLNRRDGKPFNAEDQELLEGLGAQAGAVIENAVLQSDIQRLFEGFVHASVVAIESRDPTTAGHSDRVARLTVSLARSLSSIETGPYARRARFGEERLPRVALCVPAARLRQGGRARARPGQGQQTLPSGAVHPRGALRSHPPHPRAGVLAPQGGHPGGGRPARMAPQP